MRDTPSRRQRIQFKENTLLFALDGLYLGVLIIPDYYRKSKYAQAITRVAFILSVLPLFLAVLLLHAVSGIVCQEVPHSPERTRLPLQGVTSPHSKGLYLLNALFNQVPVPVPLSFRLKAAGVLTVSVSKN